MPINANWGEWRENEIADANAYGVGRWEVRRNSSDDGFQVIALKSYRKGDLVHAALKVSDNEERTVHTLQKDWNKHIDIDIPGRFFNHSCCANLGIHDNHAGAYDFVALEDIPAGSELRWDYATVEYEIGNFPAECLCGSKQCRSAVRGFKFSSNTLRSQYGGYIAAYLKSNAQQR